MIISRYQAWPCLPKPVSTVLPKRAAAGLARDSVQFAGRQTLLQKLFPGGVENLNFCQGDLPNCQTLGTIYALSRNPNGARILRDMIEPCPEGGYQVTFRKYPHLKIPVSDAEIRIKRPAAGRTKAPQVHGSPGLRILEMAYARLKKTLHPDRFGQVPEERILDVYGTPGFEYDESVVMRDFTGWPAENKENRDDPSVLANPTPASAQDPEQLSGKAWRKQILQRFDDFSRNPERYVMTVYTRRAMGRRQKFVDPGEKLLTYHVFAVEKTDPRRQMVYLRDTHNTEIGLALSYPTFFKSFRGWSLAEMPQQP